jgi:hypothetical protein
MRYLTLILGVVFVGGSLCFAVADGGNVDFYRRPLSLAWIVITILTTMQPQKGFRSRFAQAWWVQPIAPVLLFFVSVAFVHLYEPFHLGLK